MRKISVITSVLTAGLIFLSGCASGKNGISSLQDENTANIEGLEYSCTVQNTYASQFRIDRYDGGYSLIETGHGDRVLVVPEGGMAPDGLGDDIIVVNQPLSDVYLAATSAMGLFAELDSCGAISFSGTKKEDWCIDEAVSAMDSGDIVYAGKYREPDYELLLSEGCTLSIQSTMIDQAPDVKDKLCELGIPVFTDYSSFEEHPLGRSEWIRVYAEMLGKADEAEKILEKQSEELANVISDENTGKTAVFFYISSNGQVHTRKPGDYVSKMIELAGGKNIVSDIIDDGKSTSSITMEMEEFYEKAKDADFIIYNATIDGKVVSIDELISKNSLLADFMAVKNGNVWCTEDNFYQETMKLGTMISDFHTVFTDNTDEKPPVFLTRLKGGEQD